jgi:hypothetical protein
MLSQSKIYAPHKSRGSDFFYGDAGVVRSRPKCVTGYADYIV